MTPNRGWVTLTPWRAKWGDQQTTGRASPTVDVNLDLVKFIEAREDGMGCSLTFLDGVILEVAETRDEVLPSIVPRAVGEPPERQRIEFEDVTPGRGGPATP